MRQRTQAAEHELKDSGAAAQPAGEAMIFMLV